jgi:predicted amidohydrolase YtcJ
LDADVFQTAPEKIKDIQIERTYLGGRLVYSKH